MFVIRQSLRRNGALYIHSLTRPALSRLSQSPIRRNSTDAEVGKGKGKELPLHKKLADAWKNTPTKWYPLPIFVGALLLVALNYRKRHAQSPPREEGADVYVNENGREVRRLRGPWSVQVMGALPLRNLSRLWGYLNSLELPMWFRPFGFRLYAFIFGCNLSEMEDEDLTHYRSLGEFFYRRLKEGVRPIDPRLLVSPADGKVLHFGTVKGSRVEQVKGITYSLDAFLGSSPTEPSTPISPTAQVVPFANRDHEIVFDEEFANVNGIDYTLDQLLGRSPSPNNDKAHESATPDTSNETAQADQPRKYGELTDASLPHEETSKSLRHDTSVAIQVGMESPPGKTVSAPVIKSHSQLYFAVIYLAPGDYHRFHSPAAWVVERRRHFVGELFSVSPFVARRLQDLFVLNERVVLLGRWKHGFFGMVPVGATNVGSILLNFDKDLRTNERGRLPPPGTFTEAVYSNASVVLNGKPLKSGEEMGGFCLGSTVVLIFEAPKNFVFDVKAGQKIKVGQRMGDLRDAPQEQ